MAHKASAKSAKRPAGLERADMVDTQRKGLTRMANGHGGDRRSGTVARAAMLKDLTNAELLARLHGVERDRLLKSPDCGTSRLVLDEWPPEYRALVALAQKRNLCL